MFSPRLTFAATFFVLGWVAERRPDLVKDIQRGGPRNRQSRLLAPFDLQPDAGRVPRRLASQPRHTARNPRRSRDGLQGAELLHHAAIALGARRTGRRRFSVGFQHLPDAPRPLRHPRRAAGTAPHRTARRGALGVSASGISFHGPPVRRSAAAAGFASIPTESRAAGLRAINRAGRPFAVYLHPWELDPDQPRLTPGRMAAFRHYLNLRRTEGRLTRLLQDFRFGTLSRVPGVLAARRSPRRRRSKPYQHT